MSRDNDHGRYNKFLERVAVETGLRLHLDAKTGQPRKDMAPFAPDWFDSMERRMATPGCMTERTFAWTSYRASGNQSKHAIHLYAKEGEAPIETPLRQRDCALDLAWLEAGHRAEWLHAPIEVFRLEAALRGVSPLSRTLVCDGFTENRERGTIASDTGYLLEPVPSPDFADFLRYSTEKNGEPKAKMIGISRSKVYRLMQDRAIPVLTFGKSVRCPRAALLEFVAANTQSPAIAKKEAAGRKIPSSTKRRSRAVDSLNGTKKRRSRSRGDQAEAAGRAEYDRVTGEKVGNRAKAAGRQRI